MPFVADDAAEPRGRREGVRRLRGRHDRRHRPRHRGGLAGAAVRGDDGRLELHLRRGARQRGTGGLARGACEPVRRAGRRAEVRRLRQPEVGGDQPGPARAGAQPQLPGAGGALRHGGAAGAAGQAARQGEGRAVGADRRAVDPGAAAECAVLFPGRAERRHRGADRRAECAGDARVRRQPGRAVRCVGRSGTGRVAGAALQLCHLAAPPARPRPPRRGRRALVLGAVPPDRRSA